MTTITIADCVSRMPPKSTSTFQRVLVVGQSPGPKFDSPVFHTSTTTGRLYAWLNDLGLKRVSFINASPDVGSSTYCNKDLDFLYTGYMIGDYGGVITLGRMASAAVESIGVLHYYRLPHPSGRNRLLNDPEYVRECLRNCRHYLERHGCH